jgi:hypothetical protein
MIKEGTYLQVGIITVTLMVGTSLLVDIGLRVGTSLLGGNGWLVDSSSQEVINFDEDSFSVIMVLVVNFIVGQSKGFVE